MKSSDAKASKCHLKFSSLMMIFIKLVYLSSAKVGLYSCALTFDSNLLGYTLKNTVESESLSWVNILNDIFVHI